MNELQVASLKITQIITRNQVAISGLRHAENNCKHKYVNTLCINRLKPSIIIWLQFEHSAPQWLNLPFLTSDIWAHWRSGLSARVPECQKLKMKVRHVWQSVTFRGVGF